MDDIGALPGADLTPKQRLFVSEYTNPTQKETFLNGTEAYSKSHPGVTRGSAAVCASKSLTLPHVKNAVQEFLAARGFDVPDRLTIAANIGIGSAWMTKEVVTKDGAVRQVKVYPSFHERLRAIKLVNEMDGSKAQIDVEKELLLQEQKAEQRKLLKSLLMEKDVSPEVDVPEES